MIFQSFFLFCDVCAYDVSLAELHPLLVQLGLACPGAVALGGDIQVAAAVGREVVQDVPQ